MNPRVSFGGGGLGMRIVFAATTVLQDIIVVSNLANVG